MSSEGDRADETVVECVGGRQLRFKSDWDVGIGGGLWTNGLRCCEHFRQHAASYCAWLDGKTVLELGAGTGLVGLYLAALLAHGGAAPAALLVTDRADHLAIAREVGRSVGREAAVCARFSSSLSDTHHHHQCVCV